MEVNNTLQTVLFSFLLIAASVWDIRKRIIPDSTCILIALTGLIDFSPVNFLGILAALPFLTAALCKPDSIGGGDIKFTAAAGLAIGFWGCVVGLILGLTASSFYILNQAIRKLKTGAAESVTVNPAYGTVFIPRLSCCSHYEYWRNHPMKKSLPIGGKFMSLFKNRTVVGVICILLSLLICFGVTPLFNKSISQKTEIVRVTKEIKAGDEITKDMIQTVEVGGFGLPENVIRQSETVIGKYAKADLSVGDYILNTKLSDTPAAENAYLYNLDGTKQAMSVTIKSFANGLSGKLQSGDIVSVIAPDYKKQGATVIPAELKYVEVISVTASSGYDANTGEAPAGDDERELPSTVTLLVSPEQSKILAELESDGKLHLSLVYRGSHANTTKF